MFVTAKLTLAEKNPNAGKTVLEVYTDSDTLTPDVAFAMRVYNSEPNNCFLIKSTRYSLDNNTQEESMQTSNAERNELIRSVRSNISSEISIDIMNGTGPDILIDTAPLAQLEKPSILMDLSKAANSFKNDDYFTNIISANENDGVLFQMPLSFDVIGIQTRTDSVGASGRGFHEENAMRAAIINDEINSLLFIVCTLSRLLAKWYLADQNARAFVGIVAAELIVLPVDLV